jgi:flotillin
MPGMAVIVVVVLVFVAIVFISLAKKLVYVSEPNEALVFSGATREVDGREVGYRLVRGGRGIRVPLLERVDRVDLTNLSIDVAVVGAYSKGGIPLNVHGVANVKMPGEEPLLNNAIERFLGRSRPEIARVAKETLEGNLRGVLAQLTPEQVNEDKESFARMLLEEAEHDMNRLGLVLDTLKIQSVTDESGYLNGIGRIRGAGVRQIATIAEAIAQADASEQQAKNWGASEAARIDADLAIAIQENNKRIADARSRREALIAESQGEVKAQLAAVRAEIERERARLLQVRNQLEADVVAPAEAEQKAREERARGDASSIVERGKAEAGALRALVEAYKQSGPSAREALAMQKLLPLVAQVAGAGRSVAVKRMTMLPGTDDAPGGALAKTALGAAEQIRAVTGVDLTRALDRASTRTPGGGTSSG